MATRPSRFRTRYISRKSRTLSSERTRFKTQLETMRSTESLGTRGWDFLSSARSSEPKKVLGALDRMGGQVPVQPLTVQFQVLDLSLPNSTFRYPMPRPTPPCTFSREQHLVVEVDPDDAAPGSHDLGDDEANLSAAASQVEDRFSGTDVPGRVSTPVIRFDSGGTAARKRGS